MKNDNITTALNLVLAVLAILGVIFALQTIYRMAVESLANDAVVYSKNNPNSDILRILQPAQAKPANH
jgi:hypothetical protein